MTVNIGVDVAKGVANEPAVTFVDMMTRMLMLREVQRSGGSVCK